MKHRQSLAKLCFIWRTLIGIDKNVIETFAPWKIIGNIGKQTLSQHCLNSSYFKSLSSCWAGRRVHLRFLSTGCLHSLTPKNWRVHRVIHCLIFKLLWFLKRFIKKCVSFSFFFEILGCFWLWLWNVGLSMLFAPVINYTVIIKCFLVVYLCSR